MKVKTAWRLKKMHKHWNQSKSIKSIKINSKNYGNLKVKAAGGLNPRLVFVKPPSLEVVLFIMMLMYIMLLIMIMILWIMMLLIRNWKTVSALEEQRLRRVSPRGLELLLRRWSTNSIIIIVSIIIVSIAAIVVIIIIVTFLLSFLSRLWKPFIAVLNCVDPRRE